MKFHHIGRPIPLENIKNNPQTRYSPLFDMYSLDTVNDLNIHIQLHAFGPHSELNIRIRQDPHVAFLVQDIGSAMKSKEVLMPLYQPFAGYQCTIISVGGQLIELIQTTLSEKEIWGDAIYRESILYPEK